MNNFCLYLSNIGLEVSYQLSVISYQLSVISYQLSDVSFQFTDYCLLFTGRLRRAFGNTEKSFSLHPTPYTPLPQWPIKVGFIEIKLAKIRQD
ncbi:MAG: hypothetical protein ACKPJT_15540 [Microcystis panniformis]